MLQLRGKTAVNWDAEPFLARITSDSSRPTPLRKHEALLVDNNSRELTAGFKAYFVLENGWKSEPALIGQPSPTMPLPHGLSYLQDGDIVRVNPRSGEIAVLYRRASRFNTMLVTERCNNNCIMCSQPPRDVDDGYLMDEWLEAIPLMDPATVELGISGGEPTLLVDGLLRLIRTCKNFLPCTALHVLSNGRFFAYLTYCQAVARIKHPDLMFGIPLYSDIPHHHDFIVQAKNAFDETVRGLLNLARCGQRIELRIVIHKLNVDRLTEFARFVVRNAPFVQHVALMGLEIVGFAKANLEDLWVDPADYGHILSSAVCDLTSHHIPTSIYNHQLCTLPPSLWPYARQSISDWKNTFFDECESCVARAECCGFFASAIIRRSTAIRPLPRSQ